MADLVEAMSSPTHPSHAHLQASSTTPAVCAGRLASLDSEVVGTVCHSLWTRLETLLKRIGKGTIDHR